MHGCQVYWSAFQWLQVVVQGVLPRHLEVVVDRVLHSHGLHVRRAELRLWQHGAPNFEVQRLSQRKGRILKLTCDQSNEPVRIQL